MTAEVPARDVAARMRRAAFAVLLLAGLADASDVPVAGHQLSLRARRTHRSATIALRDPAIAAPFPDPTTSASLVLSAGILPGQCRVEIPLVPAGWRPLGSRTAPRGYRYRAPDPATAGVRRVLLRPGVLAVSAGGAGWPCDLAADTQRLPASVVLRLGGARYCTVFDGAGAVNRRGRLVVHDAVAPAACPKTDLTAADLNVLHGLFCPAPTAGCRLDDRLDLLFQWVAAAGCPDVVTLQEVAEALAPKIVARRASACPFAYEVLYQKTFAADDELVLTRYPAVSLEVVKLQSNLRTVLHARLDHPIGPVDVFSTHLASSSDGAQFPCDATVCAPECLAAGAANIRQCQGVQVRAFVEARHDVATPAILTGDLNEDPTSFVYQHLTAGTGWIDTYLAAGNPECVPATGAGCTSGRVDDALDQMESTASNENERIDYILLVPPGPGSLCSATLDGSADGDGDGTATRLFADQSNPFAPACGPQPAPMCWSSDHEGAELDLECG